MGQTGEGIELHSVCKRYTQWGAVRAVSGFLLPCKPV